jgi:eukaryotic-like serine/threonine-protein kinase
LFTVRKGNEAAIWILDLETNESEPLIADSGVNYTQPVFSPDGQWIAYQSTETGSNEIFVQPFPPTGAKRQLPHTIDNHHPTWSADGSELIYIPGPGRFESVPIRTQPGFSFGPAGAMADIPMNQAPDRRRQYDVMPDGSGFLGFVTGVDSAGVARNEIYIVYNWFDELKRLVPTE